MSAGTVDQRNKKLEFDSHAVLCQVLWYDDERCLVEVRGWRKPVIGASAPNVHTGFYVPRRGEGGVLWDIDVVERVRRLCESDERQT